MRDMARQLACRGVRHETATVPPSPVAGDGGGVFDRYTRHQKADAVNALEHAPALPLRHVNHNLASFVSAVHIPFQ
jgi:hypothetical protein